MVAPLVGAWIEIMTYWEEVYDPMSLLSWERGLKYQVARPNSSGSGRSSRGSVD